MSLIYADRVKETTATTGAGTLTLAGAVAGFQSFLAGIGDGNAAECCLLSGNGTDWETGLYTYTASGTTLARTTIYASSNSGSAISLTGTSTVFGDAPAHRIGRPGLFGPAMSAPTPTRASTGLSTWLNQGSATTGDGPTGLWITLPPSSGVQRASLYGAAPSPPYTRTALVSLTCGGGDGTNNSLAQFGWTDGTQLQVMQLVLAGDNFPYIQIAHATSSTGAQSTDFSKQGNWPYPIGLQINDDATTVHFRYSFDLMNFIEAFSVAKASGFLGSGGYSHILFGVGGASNNDGINKTATLFSLN